MGIYLFDILGKFGSFFYCSVLDRHAQLGVFVMKGFLWLFLGILSYFFILFFVFWCGLGFFFFWSSLLLSVSRFCFVADGWGFCGPSGRVCFCCGDVRWDGEGLGVGLCWS